LLIPTSHPAHLPYLPSHTHPQPSPPTVTLMSQANATREKRVPKDTAGIAQFRESVLASNKRRDTIQSNKDLKAQGVGSTIPANRRAEIEEEAAAEESTDEEYDVTLAEIQAEEARVNALRAKIAKRDEIRFKTLRRLDESELQKLWESAGEETSKNKPKPKPKPQSSATQDSSKPKSKVSV
ncbi:unnamed protein product, partial [Rhizoctonia solani]